MPSSSENVLRIATRRSPLALWQAEHVRQRLQDIHKDLRVELLPLVTQGDKTLDAPLAKIGGKGLFVKELEHALLTGTADIAAHSMKDVPAALPDGLVLPVMMAREDPRDALVSPCQGGIRALPAGARVGTCSLRRKSQLRLFRRDLNYVDLRGNVNTRLARLDKGDFEAIVLAWAGLTRLGLSQRITETLPLNLSLPAVGQGVIGIECRRDDVPTLARIAPLDHPETACCVRAERAMSAALGGGCQAPIAGYGRIRGVGRDRSLSLHGRVAQEDGTRLYRASGSLPMVGAMLETGMTRAEALGRQVADDLLASGAEKVLACL